MNTNSKNKIPVCILFGPTGVGKTEIIAECLSDKYEVVNADATQVYQFLDIGSAKPSLSLRKQIPHHLVDIVDPAEQFTVADFVKLADRAVQDIASRGKRPVVAGGTAFYIKNFLYGTPPSPPSDPETRRILEQECKAKGLEHMHQELAHLDKRSAERINENDEYRILRALEVFRTSGKPLSAFPVPKAFRGQYRFCLLGLFRERAQLIDRIFRRVDAMFDEGLADEVAALVKKGYTERDPGFRGIGYAEFFGFYEGHGSIESVREQIKLHSRQYAKRQMTFFRSLPDVEWFSPEDIDKISDRIAAFFER
ncbi:MAG: tRNA (adenosine(37)-N6)-dimethylallyltransferase MiaA [Spirochaetales bacterium]|nr:tRNA (adenosine(37)-N6)-dimethylallyltransferase MiaA [Spirochaetales bacterium]